MHEWWQWLVVIAVFVGMIAVLVATQIGLGLIAIRGAEVFQRLRGRRD
jgi:hypothetical protein